MSLASRLLAVAHDATDEVVAELVDGKFMTIYQGFTPATVAMDAKSFKRVPAEQAERLVHYLDAASLRDVWKRDRRKGVRLEFTQCSRLPSDLVGEVVEWALGYDSPFVPASHVATLLEGCSDAELDHIATNVQGAAAAVFDERVRRAASAADVDALVAAKDRNETFLGLLRSPHREVRNRAAELGADRMATLGSKVSRVSASWVPALLEIDELRAATVAAPAWRSRYGSSFTQRGLQVVLDELSGERASEAFELLEGTNHLASVARSDRATEVVAPRLGADQVRQLLRNEPTERAFQVLVDRALELMVSARQVVTTMPDELAELAQLVARNDLGTLGCARASELLAVTGDVPLVTHLLVGAACGDVSHLDGIDELRAALARCELRAEDRFALLAFADTATITSSLRGIIDELTDELSAATVDRLLEATEVAPEMRVELSVACGTNVSHLRWLGAGTAVNPCDDELLAEVARRCEHPSRLQRAVMAHPAVRPVLVARCSDGTADDELASELVSHVELSDDELAQVCASWSQVATAVLTRSTITVARREMLCAMGLAPANALLESFSRLAPAPGERGLLTGELFRDASDHVLLALLSKVPLSRCELLDLFAASPELLTNWSRDLPANPAEDVHEVLAELVARPDFTATAHAVGLAVQHLGDDVDARSWLAATPATLVALRNPRDIGAGVYPRLLRIVFELVHDRLGDDPAAWRQFAKQLDDWPGSIDALATVSKVAAGSL